MKVFTIIIIVMGLLSFGFKWLKKSSVKELPDYEYPEPEYAPFEDLSLTEARARAFEQVEKNNGSVPRSNLLIVLFDKKDKAIPELRNMGFGNDEKKLWSKQYLAIAVEKDSEDGKSLVEQYHIATFPTCITEQSSLDQSMIFEKVHFASTPQGKRRSEYNLKEVTQENLDLYRSGKFPKLAIPLRDHLEYLALPQKELQQLYLQLTNDAINQMSEEDKLNYKGYRFLKANVKDVRLDWIEELLSKRKLYNEAYEKLMENRGTKNQKTQNADFIIWRAINNSFELCGDSGDEALFALAESFRKRMPEDRISGSALEGIMSFYIAQKDDSALSKISLEYFGDRAYNIKRHRDLAEASAAAILKTSADNENLEQALSWMNTVNKNNENLTRLNLQVALMNRLGQEHELIFVENRIKEYKNKFERFAALYPPHNVAPKLIRGNINKHDYKDLVGVPGEYNIFYKYIAREGSIFKKGQKIEPIALLNKNESEVTILSRVHLKSGSILPVTHYRSYYIKSTFSTTGEHLSSEYAK